MEPGTAAAIAAEAQTASTEAHTEAAVEIAAIEAETAQAETEAAVAIAETQAEAAVAIAEAQAQEIDEEWLMSEFAALRSSQAETQMQLAQMAEAIGLLASTQLQPSTPTPPPETEAETTVIVTEPETVNLDASEDAPLEAALASPAARKRRWL